MGFRTHLILVFAAINMHSGISGDIKADEPDRQNENIVQTTHGRVQGRTETIRVNYGREVTVDEFLGIPYAKPPVGDLRFKHPVPADPWDDVLQATTPPNSCMQVLLHDPVIVPNPSTPLSEDCLYLNIWRPRCEIKGRFYNIKLQKLTTMVWTHGGSLTFGSSTVSLYNGALLAASECVIVASINYRLGPLGYLFLDIPENPGNMGFLDMTLALQWISDNVENFGGKKDSITAFGNSAGGGASALFLVSPLTKNLIKNAIIQSGAPTGSVSGLVQHSKETALETAFIYSDIFNCHSDNRTAILECLKQVSAANLTLGHLALLQGFTRTMVAVVDGNFMTHSVYDILKNGDFKRSNILLGTTKDDGTSLMNFFWPGNYNLRNQQTPDPLTDEELDQNLIQFINALYKQEYSDQILADVKDVYQLDQLKQEVPDASFTLLKYVITDAFFRCPALLLATVYANASLDVYLYSFNHVSDFARLPAWAGVTHQYELPFLFGNNVTDIPTFSPREIRLSRRIMNLWANFAKYGNPNGEHPSSTRWPKYSLHNPDNIQLFTVCDANIQVDRTEARRCAYWNSLPQDYLKNIPTR